MTIKEAVARIEDHKIVHKMNEPRAIYISEALDMVIQASRNMEEIVEIMKCDADAETKCKMISNILTAKPHYFETVQDKQAESEKYQKAFDDGYKNGYEQARFDYEQKPCDDAISRQEMLDEINRIGIKAFETYNDYSQLYDFVDTLPPVTQKSGNKIVDIIKCKDCKHCMEWRSNPEVIEKYGQLYECSLLDITDLSPEDYCSKAERKK